VSGSVISSVQDSYKEIKLNGNSRCELIDDQVLITIDEIANNRDWNNLSGTLAVELWALSEPYRGGGFQGQPLAATIIGEIYGQHCLRDCHYQLNAVQPNTANNNICLMLREWQGADGYITRDYVNLPSNTLQAGSPATRSARGNVIEVAFREDAVIEVTPVEKTAFSKTQVLKTEVLKTEVSKTSDAKETKKSPAKPSSKTPAKPTESTGIVANGKVSVNSASLEELHAVKGINKKLAQAIIDARPFGKKKDLLSVNGLGEKTLKKIEDDICL